MATAINTETSVQSVAISGDRIRAILAMHAVDAEGGRAGLLAKSEASVAIADLPADLAAKVEAARDGLSTWLLDDAPKKDEYSPMEKVIPTKKAKPEKPAPHAVVEVPGA